MKSSERLVLQHLTHFTAPLLDPLKFTCRPTGLWMTANPALHYTHYILIVDLSPAFSAILPPATSYKTHSRFVKDSLVSAKKKIIF